MIYSFFSTTPPGAAATTLVSAIPKSDMSAMTHVGFLYTFLRTFGAIESP